MRRIGFLFLFIFIATVLLLTNCTNNQTSNSSYIISLEDAEEILLTEVLKDSVITEIKVHELTEPLYKYSSIASYDDTYILTQKSWFFFIDDNWNALWAHPCRYVLINYYRQPGTQYSIIDEDWPPDCFGEMVEIDFR